ncbi:alternate-type signal peptide domain-containing protein [Arthrobacter gengyunqii]|uniref:Alternate-type signal peptide domain-containing protein n=1 Tax=Arthrobacter gengyunqii TaxID=2886940 RepID=A0A9X1M1R2_9MICC|nr:alternate-type signal peptide domain-containing protein [Arthrobacter gengyunqii]MCC3269664.1 alternate-type signal peptide domain-containing protein [Arthrobacter gengyunqii]UOY97123.1 alternate-type signal peptide domain-containing protein [Arthrobacter gengyunqii]
MAKGALAIGVGAALLLGGGGTLAIWNDSETTAAGSITAGDLQLSPVVGGDGKWTNAVGTVVDLNTYKVVPGDVLTYTQKLNVKLTGDLMTAKLSMTQPTFVNGGFAAADVTVDVPTLKKADGTVIPSVLKPADSGDVIASAKFTFNDRIDQKQSSVNAAATFGAITFKLDQQAPATKP